MGTELNSILGKCERLRDSGKPIQNAELEVNISIKLSGSSGFGATAVQLTASGGTSRRFYRQAYKPSVRGSIEDPPPAGFFPRTPDYFFLVSNCCCWKCRYGVRGINRDPNYSLGAVSFVGEKDFSIPWTFSSTTGGITTTADGEYLALWTAAPAEFPWTSGGTLTKCHDQKETSPAPAWAMSGIVITSSSNPYISYNFPKSFTYLDSSGKTLSGDNWNGDLTITVSDFILQPPANAIRGSVCEDTPHLWAQVEFKGDYDSGVGDLLNIDAAVRVDLSLT